MLSLLMSFWQGELDIVSLLFVLGSYAALLFVMLPVHECAHAFAAYKLGDTTARWNGRLTLNPLKHLDPFGSVMLVLFGIGYARPVPVNPYNFRKPKRDMALTALAGPLSNLAMAILSVGLFRIVLLIGNDLLTSYAYLVLIVVFASVNISLAVFNLLPIPPLDGSRIFAAILPDKWTAWMNRYEQYVIIVIFALLFTGVLDVPLRFLRYWFGFAVCGLFGMPNLF